MMKNNKIWKIGLGLMILLLVITIASAQLTPEEEMKYRLMKQILEEEEGRSWLGWSWTGINAIVLIVILMYFGYKISLNRSGGAKAGIWIVLGLVVIGSVIGNINILELIWKGGKLPFVIGGKWAWGILILFLLFILFPFIIGIPMYKKEEEVRNRMKLVGGNIATKIRWFAKGMVNLIPRVNKLFNVKEPTLVGKLQDLYSKNRDLFNDLVHYTTRLEVYHNYWMGIEQCEWLMSKLNGIIGVYKDFDKVKEQLDIYRLGNGKVDEEEIKRGWNTLNAEVVELLNTLLIKGHLLFDELKNVGTDEEKKKEIATKYQRIMTDLNARLGSIGGTISKHYEEYVKRKKAYGAHKVANAVRIIAYDQLNASGASMYYPHTYIFAKKGAPIKGGGIMEEDQEISMDGFLIEEGFEHKDDMGDYEPGYMVRKLERPWQDRKFPSSKQLEVITGHIFTEWKAFITDLRYGTYHPKTRTASMYEHALEKDLKVIQFGAIDDSRVPIEPKGTGPAFDLRARENPGLLKYTGRRRYDDPDDAPFRSQYTNRFPAFSAQGLKMALEMFIEKKIQEETIRHKMYGMFVGDAGKIITEPTRVGTKGLAGHLEGH